MVHYQLDYVIEEIRKNDLSGEQRQLKKYVGADFTKEEAKYIWERVIDHKWYVGERLKRDIGLRVAAVDYVENFYDASIFRRQDDQRRGFFNRIARPLANLTHGYFTAKSKTISSF